NIRRFRKGKMTQKELAEKIGKTESSVRKYEKGLVNIPLDVIEKIASALRVAPANIGGYDYIRDKNQDFFAEEVDERFCFIEYLNHLGYKIKESFEDVQTPIDEFISQKGYPYPANSKEDLKKMLSKKEIALGVVEETFYLIIVQIGTKKIVFDIDEFEKLQADVKDFVDFKIWQFAKKQKQQKGAD
ncbi:MAG: helix-turn-helix domain-containing protein, partial [Clostridiales bacterium]|nr:helix-turn-helix domain-containing protein [Clostridiales bacterium]